MLADDPMKWSRTAVTIRVESVGDTLERAGAAVNLDHAHRGAVLALVRELAARLLRSHSSTSGAARPPRLTLIVTPRTVRVEARGASINEAARVRHGAGRLVPRWGITHFHDQPPVLWFDLGNPGDLGDPPA